MQVLPHGSIASDARSAKHGVKISLLLKSTVLLSKAVSRYIGCIMQHCLSLLDSCLEEGLKQSMCLRTGALITDGDCTSLSMGLLCAKLKALSW